MTGTEFGTIYRGMLGGGGGGAGGGSSPTYNYYYPQGGGDGSNAAGMASLGEGLGSMLSWPFMAMAAKKAARTERENQERNQQLIRQWNQYLLDTQANSLGATGRNVLWSQLPSLGGFENRAAGNALGIYDAANQYYGSPANRLGMFSAAVNSASPGAQGAIKTINDLYSGALTQNRLASEAPVAAARTAMAQTTRQGILQGLMQRLNALQSQNQAKGYSGTGSFTQNQMLGASVGANQQAAAAIAQAALENAQQRAAIEEMGRQQAIQSVGVPFQLGQQNAALTGMPVAMMNQSYVDQLGALAPFRVGYQAPPYGAMRSPLMEQPIPSNSQIWWTGAGEGMKGLGQVLGPGASMAQSAGI